MIRAEDGRLAIVSACTDISETMEAQKRLVENNAQLTRQNQELHFLNNQIPGGYHRCKNDESMELTYISNRFLSIFGYSREEIQERFDNRLINMVHPDDRKAVYSSVCYTREKAEMRNLELSLIHILSANECQRFRVNGSLFQKGVRVPPACQGREAGGGGRKAEPGIF